MKVMVCHFVSDSHEVMTALVVMLPLIVVVEISLQLHGSFCLVVALLTWSNCCFDSQVEKKQCRRDTSCSCTHASLASRLKSRQRMAKYIQASSMLPRLKAKIWVRSCLSLVIFLVARGIE